MWELFGGTLHGRSMQRPYDSNRLMLVGAYLVLRLDGELIYNRADAEDVVELWHRQSPLPVGEG
jgi:hypothetical protein